MFEQGGRTRRIECEHVLLHQGVVPNVQATRALRRLQDAGMATGGSAPESRAGPIQPAPAASKTTSTKISAGER